MLRIPFRPPLASLVLILLSQASRAERLPAGPWLPLRTGLGAEIVRDLIPHGNALYAVAREAGGFYRTESASTSWTGISRDIPGTARGLAGIGSRLVALAAFDVYLSDDEGASWRRGQQLAATSILAVESTLYARSYYTVHRSRDLGETWDKVYDVSSETGFPGTLEGMTAVRGSLFLSTSDDGLRKSRDEGATWEKVPDTRHVRATRFSATPDGLFAAAPAALLRSTPEGAAWSAIPLPGTFRLYDMVAWRSHLFLATDKGLLHSHDLGRTWDAVDTTLSRQPLHSLALFDEHLVAGTEEMGVWVRPLADWPVPPVRVAPGAGRARRPAPRLLEGRPYDLLGKRRAFRGPVYWH